MPTQVEMKGKICPIMSTPRDLIMCQGDRCNAFGSRETRAYLAKDGSLTTAWGKTKIFSDPTLSSPLGAKPTENDSEEIEKLVAEGWEKQGGGAAVRFTKLGESTCWCDAMAGNAACGYEAP